MADTVESLNFRMPENFCFNVPKIQTNRPNVRVLCPKDADGVANGEDPDQTAPLIWVCTVCPDQSVQKLMIITICRGGDMSYYWKDVH